MTDNYIYKTGPNYFFIIFMLIGAGLCGFVASLALLSDAFVNGTSEKTGHIILIVFISFFALFGLCCLFMVITFKMAYLTQSELVLKRPILFSSRSILLKDMVAFAEKGDKIDTSRSAFSTSLYTIGHTTTIKLNTGENIKISSIEIWGYNSLLKKMEQQSRVNNDRHHLQ